jgi:hypothetical protein
MPWWRRSNDDGRAATGLNRIDAVPIIIGLSAAAIILGGTILWSMNPITGTSIATIAGALITYFTAVRRSQTRA